MFKSIKSKYLVPDDGSFRIAHASTLPPGKVHEKKEYKKQLNEVVEQLEDLQRILYAEDKYALLLIFQAIDAAGKDSTIRAVMSGVNPAGCQVYSFKRPTPEELDHDFLWRTARCLPERGRIGIFNRSYYEEVLVTRVHPEYLDLQKLPEPIDKDKLWKWRFESIRDHEKHLARNGTVILKFWLNVSKDEQRRRFLSRIDEPHKNWKFEIADVRERGFWDQYMKVYEKALNETSRPWAPWYAVPADNKPFMRVAVAEIIVKSLTKLGLEYPHVSPEVKSKFSEMRRMLENED
ncbi:polyphosphate kinase 2 family protein [uncultured Desulfosarcina sp.]|uniref:polyphosphate kinase 2 family protein n=1 Tax=uncultured Desulfosarcina sp. TaxID=218289 RepID=UPI0029C71977|nr:polyphosphate kinase 2 family protein [uncultured Desulfosarcina sp.]